MNSKTHNQIRTHTIIDKNRKSSFNFIEQTKLRIVQQNLVSVTGLSTQFDNPDLLCDNQHFGKYGNVNKIIISTQGKYKSAFIQVYITFDTTAEAAFTIKAMDGIKIGGREISATFGTTKYCTYFLKQNQCRNQKCFYLHEFDTKNELTDGVKNNLDFLDDKAQKIINKNIKMYLEKQFIQQNLKQISEFPSYKQTIQYLIDQGILKKQAVQKIRLQLRNVKNNVECKNIQEQKNINNVNKINNSPTKSNKSNNNNININNNNNSPNKSLNNQSINIQRKQFPLSIIKKQIFNNNSSQQSENFDISDNTNCALTQKKYEDCLIQQEAQISSKYYQQKNKKCNSLSTAPSPTKYEKNTQIEQENIDKTIQKRIINEIMKNKLIYKSKMDFVIHANNYAKQQNNKIVNYVRKYLLNEV